jgi:hypothetical protein
MMETFLYPQFPDHLSHVRIALFTQVVNSTELRSRIIKAATLDGEHGVLERDAVNFSFINAQLVSLVNHSMPTYAQRSWRKGYQHPSPSNSHLSSYPC